MNCQLQFETIPTRRREAASEKILKVTKIGTAPKMLRSGKDKQLVYCPYLLSFSFRTSFSTLEFVVLGLEYRAASSSPPSVGNY